MCLKIFQLHSATRLIQVLVKEGFHLGKSNDVLLVVKVSVACPRDQKQFLVVGVLADFNHVGVGIL